MGDNSKIAWTNATWNFLLGCDKVSQGCKYCYAMASVHRMSHHPNPKVRSANEGLTRRSATGSAEWTGLVRVIEERFNIPMRWASPRMIFVNSLSDLGHPLVSDEVVLRMLETIRHCPRHVFQILSKRAARLAQIIELAMEKGAPLNNVWWGVTVENQEQADKRLPDFLDESFGRPGDAFSHPVMRWISVEPMLAPIDLRRWLHRVEWVVCGGESGTSARAFSTEWAEDLAEQCREAGVPFFMKQLGQHYPDFKNPLTFPESLQRFQWPRCAPGWVQSDRAPARVDGGVTPLYPTSR